MNIIRSLAIAFIKIEKIKKIELCMTNYNKNQQYKNNKSSPKNAVKTIKTV